MHGARIKNLSRSKQRKLVPGVARSSSVLSMIFHLRTGSAGRTFDVALRFGKDVLNAAGGRFSLDVLVTNLVNDG
jgi:hypothetical protein